MADLLIQQGLLDAGDWAQTLGEQLARHQGDGNDTIEAYYQAVLAALQQLLGQQSVLPSAEVEQRERAWKAAYLSTLHSQPVVLNIN